MDVRCPHSASLRSTAVKGMLPLSFESCRLDQTAKVKLCEPVGGTSLHYTFRQVPQLAVPTVILPKTADWLQHCTALAFSAPSQSVFIQPQTI